MSSHLNYFSGIITYEDVINHKPFPDAYNLAIKLSKKPESNCIAIEDSMIGLEAARAANLNCLLTLPPWSNSYEKYSIKATACVNSLGNANSPSILFYGKELCGTNVDFEYLTNIIN